MRRFSSPQKKVIQCSHTAELAVGFGRKVRNLVDTDAYKNIFPNLALSTDSKAAGRWNTSKGGDYFANFRQRSFLFRVRVVDDEDVCPLTGDCTRNRKPPSRK